MLNIKEKVKEFKSKYANKCYALANWKNLQMKDFGVTEMLECICKAANGSLQEMAKIIDHLTSKKKTFGRTQVYADKDIKMVDLVRNESGELELKGYNPDAQLPLKGQHQKRNPKIFRKTDDKTNKTFQNAEERMYNLGEKVRELFPGEDNHFITFAMQAIRKYAEEKKVHTDKVIKGLQKGRYKLDDDIWRIIPNVVKESRKRHIIFINESDANRIADMLKLDEHLFFVNMKNFISQLLQDPVNAKVPLVFSQRGFNRSKIINYLLSGNDPILKRKQRISDKDENGNPKTATMMVKFQRNDDNNDEYVCPKKSFDRKLQKLYIKMFQRNVPQRNKKNEFDVDEATGCGGTGAAGGAFVTKFGDVQRRQMPIEIGESTTTFNTGNYTYTAPVLGDKESCARHNGDGGSVSINQAKNIKK
jgi:hypothetical protein